MNQLCPRATMQTKEARWHTVRVDPVTACARPVTPPHAVTAAVGLIVPLADALDYTRHLITVAMAVVQVLHVLCGVAEYDELPVRHNEDKINTSLAGEVRWPTDTRSADDPHTKANLLLQVLPSLFPPR